MGGKTQLQLEKEDKERDAAFNKAMHGKTAAQANSVATILFKNPEAKQAALDAYFKHFDNKKADNETEADRKVCLAAFLDPPTSSCGGATASGYPFSRHGLTTDSFTGTNRRVRHIDKAVSTPPYLRDSLRNISLTHSARLQLLQPCYRHLRVRMGPVVPLLPFLRRRALLPSHCPP